MARKPSFSWGKLSMIAVVLLLACSVYLNIQPTQATHFQYGTYEWDTPPDQTTYFNLGITQGWRLGFWRQWDYDRAWERIPNGTQLSVGSLNMARLSAPRTTERGVSTPSTNLSLKVTGAWRDTTTTNQGYWYGTWSNIISNSGGPFANWRVFDTLESNYWIWFDTCCRVSTLMDGNRDNNNFVGVWVIPNRRRWSLVTQGFPREYLYRGKQMLDYYRLGASNREFSDQKFHYSISPRTDIGGSRLNEPIPGLWGVSTPNSRLSLASNGVMTWIPNIVVGDTRNGNYCRAQQCPYAISVTISDFNYPITAGSQTINPALAESWWSTTRRIATQIDWMFIVIKPCEETGGICPPEFHNKVLSFETITTVPNRVSFYITDSQTSETELQWTPLPSELSFVSRKTNGPNNKSCRIDVDLTHDPDIDGANSAMVCFTASNALGMTAVGNYCPEFRVIRPNFMFLTGILREFQANSANRMDGIAFPFPLATLPGQFLTDGNGRKPVVQVSPTETATWFDTWWNDETSTRLATANMVSYYNAALDHSIDITGLSAEERARIAREPFMDPRRRMYSFRRPYWQPSAARFYTFEVHTTFDVLTSETSAQTALKFGVSGGELFVYINSVKVLDVINMSTQTVTDTDLLQPQVTKSLTYQQIRALIDPHRPAPIPPISPNGSPETYPLDLFYTHRNSGPSSPTGFHLEFGSSTQCSALTVLRSQQWRHLAEVSLIFNYVGNNFARSDFFFSNPQTTITNAGDPALHGIRLLPGNFYGSAATIFYNKSPLKVLNGFEATFSFHMTRGTPGLAFVIQSQSPSARGSEAAGLGYAGISNAVVIEFDSRKDEIDGSFEKNHISCHRSTPSNIRVSASETKDSWPLGSSPVGNISVLPFDWSNSTVHDVRVELLPAQTAYWIYVYVNKNIKALYTAQFPRAELNAMFKDGAYIGFSTSNYGTAADAGEATITKFGMTVIPPLASSSGLAVGEPKTYSATAGSNFSAKIQLRDACGTNLLVRGEANRFRAALIHRDSDKGPSTDPNVAVDRPVVTVTDEDQGIYKFTAPITRSGVYELYIFYQEAGMDTGEGQPIGFPALTYAHADYNNKKIPQFKRQLGEPSLAVTAATGLPDPATSIYAYPAMAPGIDNAAPPTPADAGVVCTVVPRDLSPATSPQFSLVNNWATFASTVTAGSQLGVCMVRGFSAQSSAVIGAAMTALNGISTQQKPVAASYTNDKAGTFSAAWIYSPTASDQRLVFSDVERVAATFSYGSAETAQSLFVEAYAPKRLNKAPLTGSALGIAGRAMMLLRPTILSAPTNSNSEFFLYSRDRFENPVDNVNDISFSFTPTLEVLDPVVVPETPFTSLPFKTKQSGRFAFNAFFFNNPVQIGTSGSLLVDAGKAHHTTSIQSGLSTGGVVNTQMSFTLSLRDAANNQILAQTSAKSDLIHVRWLHTETRTVVAAMSFQDGLITSTSDSIFSRDPTTGSVFANERYQIVYTPKFAGTYFIQVFINPPAATPYDAGYEMVDSKGLQVAISPGPVHTKSTVAETTADGSPTRVSTSLAAGKVFEFNVQTRDEFDNQRFTAYDEGKEIRLAISQNGQTLTGSAFTDQVDVALSAGVTNNAHIVGTHSGSGVYRFAVAFKKTTTPQTPITLSFSLFTNNALTGLITLIQTPDITTASWQAQVAPGELSEKSEIGAWCPTALLTNPDASPAPQTGSLCSVPTGETLSNAIYRVNTRAWFALRPFDRYGNQISPSQDNLSSIASELTLQFENMIGSYDLQLSFDIVTTSGNFYIGSFAASRAGSYTMRAQLTSTSVSLAIPSLFGSTPASPNNKFGVVASPTAIFKMPVNLPSAAIVDQEHTFEFTDLDIHLDPRSTTLTAPPFKYLPETTFGLYRKTDTGTCVVEGTCGVSGTRPGYQCTFTPQLNGRQTFYVAAIDESTVAVGIGANGSTTTATCASPTDGACPAPRCSVSSEVVVTPNGNTSAFIGGVSRIAEGSTTETGAVSLSYTGDEEIALHSLWDSNQDQSTRGLRAGSSLVLYIFQWVESAKEYSNKASMEELSLRLVPQLSSKFKPLVISSEVNSNVSTGQCTTNTGFCVGRQGAGYYRLVISEKIVQPATDNNNFEIWFATRSSIKKLYSYQWRPADFSPQHSTMISSGAREIVAGKTWQMQFVPIDKFGNLITKKADFLRWEETTAIPFSALDPPTRIIPTPEIIQLVANGQPMVTMDFVDVSESAAASVIISFSGHYFTLMGVRGFNLPIRTGTTDPSDWSTLFLSKSFHTVVVKANDMHFPNTVLTLAPSADPLLQQGSWLRSIPVANEGFDIHILPQDVFKNPTNPWSDVKIKVLSGDTFTPLNDIQVTAPSGQWNWVQSPFSSSRATIFTLSGVVINRATRSGFRIVAQSDNAALQTTPSQTIFLRSKSLRTTGDAIIADFGGTQPLAADHSISIDSVFKFTVILKDSQQIPFLYNVGSNDKNDNSQVSVTLTSEQPKDGSSTEKIVKAIAATSSQETRVVAGVTLAAPGRFTIVATDLFFTGIYKLVVNVNDAAGNKVVVTHNFNVKTGKPFLDYTHFVLEPLSTRSEGVFTYKLYDRLQNLITDDLTPPKGAAGGSSFYPITTQNKVYPSIQQGVVNCFDVHDVTPNNLQYALPPLRPSAAPNFRLDTSFNPNDATYSVRITPAPSGTYTFNITYVDSSLTVPASFLSCNSLIPLGFIVATGPPSADTSFYTINPVNSRNQHIPWTTGVNVGSAGSPFVVELNLLDADGNPSQHSADARLFFNPDPNSTQLDKNTALYYQSNTDKNIDSLTSSDLTFDVGRGYWRFYFTPAKAQTGFTFALFILEPVLDDPTNPSKAVWKRVTGIIPVGQDPNFTSPTRSAQTFTVTHGAPSALVVTNLSGLVDVTRPQTVTDGIVAGATTSFNVFAVDRFDNPVTSQTSSRLEVIVSRDQTSFHSDPIVPITGLVWSVPSSSFQSLGGGITSVTYTPTWEGQYSFSVRMVSNDGLETFASATAPSNPIEKVLVVHATCAGRHLAANGSTGSFVNDKMCASTGVCVKDFNQCEESDKNTCEPGKTRITPTSPCSSYTDSSYIKCPDGTFALDQKQCAPALVCPVGTKRCPSDQTQCRSKLEDCPSAPACPPGLIICPSQLSCARSLGECPRLPETVISSCSTVLCPTGSCVLSTADCPTKPSCPMSQVLCLTDGSCKGSADKCPPIPPAQILTPSICSQQNKVLCPTGDLCVTSISECPSLPTCPVGQVLCAIDNTCQATGAQCRVPTTDPTAPTPIKPDATSPTCSATEFRCPAGECVQNLGLCSSQVTCPKDAPVLCADKTCKASLALCTVPPSCPSNTVACPATGSCVASYDQCSTPLSCPASKPIMCADSSCVDDMQKCGEPLNCPPALPYTCPSSAVCRAALVDCPTLPHCPVTKPLVCDDGSCSISPQMCLSANPGSGSSTPGPSDPDDPDAPGPSGCHKELIRCNSGECSSNPLTCPTQVTCTPGTSRCGDGTCRVNCDNATANTCADRNLISCPQSSAGMACAKTLAECPQGFTCPLTKPVRCIDSTCALSTADCPISQDSPPAERVPCPDGSWVIGSSSDCPTAVTCPHYAPIKCYDQTCQKTLDQCPVSTQCDITSATPFRCPSGLCAATLWSCNSVDAQICPPAKPVKCPARGGGNDCFESLSACPDVGSGNKVDTTKIPDPIETWISPCPPGFTQCRDNSCQETPSSCPALICPSAFPHACHDGSCAVSANRCPSLSGCPWNTPVKCSGIGNCVKSLAQCQKPTCPYFSCPDGTCEQDFLQCPAANGCKLGKSRCGDGTCVDDIGLCTSQSNFSYANSCPPGTPHRCPSGLCVANPFACPSMENQSPESACPAEFPVRCADGLCRESTQLCPLIKPCQSGFTRCNDGFCRDTGEPCPQSSNCPGTQIRCKQTDFAIQLPNGSWEGVAILDGMCAEPGECLANNGCPIRSGQALNRCPENGRCVSDLSLCRTNVRLPDGCLSNAPVKCWNGSCAVSADKCPANNNCPSDKPLRCPNGECSSQTDGCSSEEQQKVCDQTQCADGSCVDNASKCHTSFGCEVTKSVRCADGTCKQLPASYRPFLTNEQANTLTCPPVISCPSKNYFMCESGACVLSRESCPSAVYNCENPEAPFRCLDNTCRPGPERCGQIEDPANPGSWIPSSGKPASCPSALPVMCDNGACVSEVYNCGRNTDPATTTITGSPTSSQRDPTKIFQVLCEDGTWRDSFAECRQFAEEVNAEVAKDYPELACTEFCPNGRCVLPGQSISSVCAVLPACPISQYRCFDGSCATKVEDCTATKKSCPAGQTLNVDGICRDKKASLRYDGCGPELHENYHCLNRECSSGPAQCLDKETKVIDPFQKDTLNRSDWGRDHGRNHDSEEYRIEEPQLVQRSVVLAPVSLEAVPNSLIAELIADFVDVQVLAAETAPIPGKSCQGDGCLANQKVYATSLMYSPLAPPQPFPIAPLSTAMTLQLSSGLAADLSLDTNIYVHPVSTSQYYNATNKLTYSRLGQFGKSDTLTAAQTVLSPAFSCSVGDGLAEPFAINIGVSSLIDRSMTPTPQPVDVCLARLHRYPQFGYSTWVCLFSEPQRLSGDPQYSVRQSTAQPLRQAISTISQCYDETLSTIIKPKPGAMEVQDDAATTSTKVPAIYAFIHSPVATSQVYLPPKDTFFRNNIIWILLVIIGGVCLIFFLIYAIMRLSRYTNKTKGIKKEIENTQREVEDMENFGDKRRDVEVGYTANPLAVSLDQQRELEETTNEEKIQRKRQIVEAQQADSAERQEIINSLDQENEAALARLQHLREVAKRK